MSADQERAIRFGMDRTRREMLAGHDDALARVEVERRLELEARRGFAQAVIEARADGHSWEQIVPRPRPRARLRRRGGREAVRVGVGSRFPLRRGPRLVALR